MTALLAPILFAIATPTGARRLAAAAAAESPLLLRPLAWTWPRHLEKRVDRFEGLHDACAVLGPGQTPDAAALRRDTPGLYVIAAAKARPADVMFLDSKGSGTEVNALVARVAPVTDASKCAASERFLWLDDHFRTVAHRVASAVEDRLSGADEAQATALAYALLRCQRTAIYGLDAVELFGHRRARALL